MTTLIETDQATVVASSESVETVFTGLVHTHIDELYNYASYMVFDRDDADDIVQKTFISLHQHIPTLDLTQPIKPWLFRVAKNHCLDYLKVKRSIVFSDLDDSFIFGLPESTPSVESQFENEEFKTQIREAIMQLPLPPREIILLKYFEGFTFEEIGAILDMPVNTAKTHFYRAKGKLYKLLESSLQISNL